MFELIGMTTGFIGLLAITGLWILLAINMLGDYNIGGVPNKWYHRILVIIAFILLIILWKEFFMNIPYTIVKQ